MMRMRIVKTDAVAVVSARHAPFRAVHSFIALRLHRAAAVAGAIEAPR
jgi:hypothetical protein